MFVRSAASRETGHHRARDGTENVGRSVVTTTAHAGPTGIREVVGASANRARVIAQGVAWIGPAHSLQEQRHLQSRDVVVGTIGCAGTAKRDAAILDVGHRGTVRGVGAVHVGETVARRGRGRTGRQRKCRSECGEDDAHGISPVGRPGGPGESARGWRARASQARSSGATSCF